MVIGSDEVKGTIFQLLRKRTQPAFEQRQEVEVTDSNRSVEDLRMELTIQHQLASHVKWKYQRASRLRKRTVKANEKLRLKFQEAENKKFHYLNIYKRRGDVIDEQRAEMEELEGRLKQSKNGGEGFVSQKVLDNT